MCKPCIILFGWHSLLGNFDVVHRQQKHFEIVLFPENPSWKYQQWRQNITVKVFCFFVILLPYLFFKTNICNYCLYCSKRNMIFNPYYASFCMPKNSLTMKNKAWPLTDVSTWKMIRSFNNSLIHWKQYYFIFILRHKLFFFRNDSLLDHIRIALHCARKLTRITFWIWKVWSWFEII